MDPYQVLNLTRTASKKAIRKAYRALARQRHPDTGGSVEAFAELKLAYEVLMDDARRHKFHATGTVDATVPNNAAAMALIQITQQFVSVMRQLLEQGADPLQQDLVELLGRFLEEKKHDIVDHLAKRESTRATMAKLLGRFQVDKGDNLLEEMVQGQLGILDGQTTLANKELNQVREALKLLKKYKFRREAPIDLGIVNWQGCSWRASIR